MKLFLFTLLTLFVSTTSFAQVPNNSVGSRHIKRNAVKTPKIKNLAVTGDKVAAKTLDHSKIREAYNVPMVTLTNGQSETIFDDGIISFQARCAINEGGNDFARVLIFSTEDGTAFDGQDTSTNLTAATAVNDREMAASSNLTTNPSVDQETDGSAITPSGNIYNVHFITGTNLFGAIGSCFIGGDIYKVAAQEVD